MKIKELRGKTPKELAKLLTDARATIIKTKFQLASRETNKHQDIKKSRKEIARILTVQKEEELLAIEQDKEKK
ncbi:MAG: 50S ribosomal protein L29 [Bacteriovoracaceae bacterium]